jgi:hypothetical protein
MTLPLKFRTIVNKRCSGHPRARISEPEQNQECLSYCNFTVTSPCQPESQLIGRPLSMIGVSLIVRHMGFNVSMPAAITIGSSSSREKLILKNPGGIICTMITGSCVFSNESIHLFRARGATSEQGNRSVFRGWFILLLGFFAEYPNELIGSKIGAIWSTLLPRWLPRQFGRRHEIERGEKTIQVQCSRRITASQLNSGLQIFTIEIKCLFFLKLLKAPVGGCGSDEPEKALPIHPCYPKFLVSEPSGV